jgi:hypothetical protein
MSYEQKYLKYKEKYLNLKAQLEGGLSLNPFRYKKYEPKADDSEELKKHMTDRNTTIDDINQTKKDIAAAQADINITVKNERTAFKKAEADKKLEALKQSGGGFNIFNKVKVEDSAELVAKREALKASQAKLVDLEKNLDRLDKLIAAQKKSDHYAKKLSKSAAAESKPASLF